VRELDLRTGTPQAEPRRIADPPASGRWVAIAEGRTALLVLEPRASAEPAERELRVLRLDEHGVPRHDGVPENGLLVASGDAASAAAVAPIDEQTFRFYYRSGERAYSRILYYPTP